MTETEVREVLGAVMDFMPSLTRDGIDTAIKDQHWQEVRLSMKGMTTDQKIDTLYWFMAQRGRDDKVATICVQNYVNALKRGGQIK